MIPCTTRFNVLLIACLFFLLIVHNARADNTETVGNVLTIALPTVALGMTAGLKDGQGAMQFGKSAALTVGVTYGLKYTIDAKRPNGNDQSFPSAHSSVSFSSAEFLRKRYGWKFGIPAYIAATFVAYSRVEADQHYTRDVIAGAGIGILSTYLFTEPYKGWHIQPAVNQSNYGLRLTRFW